MARLDRKTVRKMVPFDKEFGVPNQFELEPDCGVVEGNGYRPSGRSLTHSFGFSYGLN